MFGDNCNLPCDECVFGTCRRSDGTCDCDPGYWGKSCNKLCPGGSASPCAGHGSCLKQSGLCECWQSPGTGYWAGEFCDQCDKLWVSPACNVPCPFADGLICSGSGTCFNGTCMDCQPLANETVRCGDLCEHNDASCTGNNCEAGYFGESCATLCPGATSTEPGASCSGHGLCTASGTCLCGPRYFGVTCARSCPVSNAGLCSSRGTCQRGVCRCASGYFGGACEHECPGSASSPCSGHGVCSSDGVCACAAEYRGTSCDVRCPGGDAQVCNNNGICDAYGACVCYANISYGYFAGEACHECAVGYVGERCRTFCHKSRGVVYKRTCVCLGGLVGADCSLQCPRDALGVICAGHGSCRLGPTGKTAVCSCMSGYFDTSCNTSCSARNCEATLGYHRAQCNPSTGSCECLSSQLGQWTGPHCSDCAAGYWGAECAFLCPCNHHGTCDQITGKCYCFFDDDNGRWGGRDCSICARGYFGRSCMSVNVNLTQPPANTLTFGKSVYSLPTAVPSAFDAASGRMYISDSIDASTIRVLESNARGELVVVGNISFGSPVDSIATSSGLWVTLRNRTSVLLQPTRSEYHLRSRYMARSSAATTTYDVVLNATLCKLVPPTSAAADDAVVECDTAGVVRSAAVRHFSEAIETVSYVGTTLDGKFVLVVGTSLSDDRNWAMLAWSAQSGSTSYVSDNSVEQAFGRILQCEPTQQSQFVCVLYDSRRLLLMLMLLDADALHNPFASVDVVEIAASSTEVTVTGLCCSTALGIGVLSFNQPNRNSNTYLFKFQSSGDRSLILTSYLESVTQAVVTAAELDEANRLLILAVESAFYLKYFTFNLFGVVSVEPSILDFFGGGVVNVTGVGFPLDQAIACNISGISTPATVVSSTEVRCLVQRARVASDGGSVCSTDIVEIVAEGSFGGRKASTVVVGINRPLSATLRAATTVTGFVGFGSSNFSSLVIVSGLGFVSSRFAQCRLVEIDSAITVYATRNVTYLNSSTVLCEQPIAPPSRHKTAIQYSHDGFYFGSSMVPYLIVGPPAGLVIEVIDPTVIASSLSLVPALNVFVTDRFHNKLHALEQRLLLVRCTSIDPLSQIAGNPEVLDFADLRSLSRHITDGLAVFDQVELVKPVAGRLILHCFSPLDVSLVNNVTLQVVAGPPAAVQIASVTGWVAGVRSPRRVHPSPMIWLVDSANNLVTVADALEARVLYSAAYLDQQEQVVPQTGVAFARQSVEGTYTFPTFEIRTAFDVPATMQFYIGAFQEHLTVILKQENCVGGLEYAVSGTFECRRCPPHGICDGTTLIAVEKGYWRSTPLSMIYYECNPMEACLGGHDCSVGYVGTLCGSCAPGFGHSGLSCGSCPDTAVGWTLVGALGIALFALLFYLSIFSMPATCSSDGQVYILERREPKLTSIVVKIGVTHFQMLGLLPFSYFSMPSYLSGYFSATQTGFRFNPNVSFLACTITSDSVTMLKLTLLLLPVAVSTFVAVSLFAAKFKTTRVTDMRKRQAGAMTKYAKYSGTLLAHGSRVHLAEEIAKDGNHFSSILTSHSQLLSDCDDDVEGGGANNEDVATTALKFFNDREAQRQQEHAEFKERLVNMACVSALVVMFFLYPTIVYACSSLFVCRDVDTGPGARPLSVLRIDPSIDCNSLLYDDAQVVAWVGLAAVGFGVPLLNYLLIVFVKWATCRGSMALAKVLFSFSGAGYRHTFWESVVLTRKFLIVISLSVIPDTGTAVLVALWVLLAAMMVNIHFTPWQHRVLEVTEVVSLSAVSTTLGMLLLTKMLPHNNAIDSVLFVLIMIINMAAIVVFVLAFLWALRRSLAPTIARKSDEGVDDQSFLSTAPTDDSLAQLRRTAKSLLRAIKESHSRSHSVTLVEMDVVKKMGALRAIASGRFRAPRKKKKDAHELATLASSASLVRKINDEGRCREYSLREKSFFTGRPDAVLALDIEITLDPHQSDRRLEYSAVYEYPSFENEDFIVHPHIVAAADPFDSTWRPSGIHLCEPNSFMLPTRNNAWTRDELDDLLDRAATTVASFQRLQTFVALSDSDCITVSDLEELYDAERSVIECLVRLRTALKVKRDERVHHPVRGVARGAASVVRPFAGGANVHRDGGAGNDAVAVWGGEHDQHCLGFDHGFGWRHIASEYFKADRRSADAAVHGGTLWHAAN